ncbi:hypothetical protein [Nocardia crassostreae]|uniref:hypothetical protein n=1 Tax=Nocardia crassostreae TaxID=53428 RepID=UPI0008346B3C|nr:hypothetical protein [Nocardia crassostreae]
MAFSALFLNVVLDNVAPERGWRYCGFCGGGGKLYGDDGSYSWCPDCGGCGTINQPNYRR